MRNAALMGTLFAALLLTVGCGNDQTSEVRLEPPGFTCTYRQTDYMGDNSCTGEQMYRYDLEFDWWTDRVEDVSVVMFEIPVRQSAWRASGPTTTCISEEVGYSSETSTVFSGHWRAYKTVGYRVHEWESGTWRSNEFLPEYDQEAQLVRAHIYWTGGGEALYETVPIQKSTP